MAGAWLLVVSVSLAGSPLQHVDVAVDVAHGVPGVPARLIPGRALLKLKSNADDETALARTLADLGTRTNTRLSLRRVSVHGWIVVNVREHAAPLPDEAQTQSLLTRLAADALVEAVSEDRWVRPLRVPNDSLVPSMWHLSVSRLVDAWDDERGNATQRIGMIDSGLIRTHEDVGAKAVVGYDFIADALAANDGDGRDPDFQDAGERCGATPHSFHGTHVAGILAASTDNGLGVAGVNWLAGLAVVRALDPCGGDLVDIMEGATWLAGGAVAGIPPIGGDRVTVMNLSLGSIGPCTAFEQDVINAIDAAGVVFVAAAGNDGGVLNSPASCDKVLAVAAHDRAFVKAPYSSFGPQVDIVAAGGDVSQLTANGILSTVGPLDSLYGFFQGTSMAAPQVAGVVSLMQAKDPAVTRARAEAALAQSGRSCTNCDGKPALDAGAALLLIARQAINPGDDEPELDDELEENDTAATARPIQCGQTYALRARARDQDWFVVDVDVGPLSIAIDAGTADLDLYVVRNGTEIVLRSETTTGTELVSATVTLAQQLQILVNPFSDDAGAARGPYSMAVTCTAATTTPPPVDPDDDPLVPADPDPGVDDDKDPIDPIGPVDPPDPNDPSDGTDDDGADVPNDGGESGPRASTDGGGADLQAVGGCASLAVEPSVSALLLLALRRRWRRRLRERA